MIDKINSFLSTNGEEGYSLLDVILDSNGFFDFYGKAYSDPDLKALIDKIGLDSRKKLLDEILAFLNEKSVTYNPKSPNEESAQVAILKVTNHIKMANKKYYNYPDDFYKTREEFRKDLKDEKLILQAENIYKHMRLKKYDPLYYYSCVYHEVFDDSKKQKYDKYFKDHKYKEYHDVIQWIDFEAKCGFSKVERENIHQIIASRVKNKLPESYSFRIVYIQHIKKNENRLHHFKKVYPIYGEWFEIETLLSENLKEPLYTDAQKANVDKLLFKAESIQKFIHDILAARGLITNPLVRSYLENYQIKVCTKQASISRIKRKASSSSQSKNGLSVFSPASSSSHEAKAHSSGDSSPESSSSSGEDDERRASAKKQRTSEKLMSMDENEGGQNRDQGSDDDQPGAGSMGLN